MSAPIVIVDEDDRPVGQATKQEAWDKGLIHRVVRIMIEDDQGRILLQHRSPTKIPYPNTWDNSAAGHVDAGEDYKTAALRELHEELGLDNLELTEVGRYRSDEMWKDHHHNRFTMVYKVRAKVEPQRLEDGKVDDARWFTLAEIKSMLLHHPEQVSDGIRQVIPRYY